MKDEKAQDKENKKEESETSFYDVMLEAIRLGLMPKSF